jgi:AraC-like DNA-binding protein
MPSMENRRTICVHWVVDPTLDGIDAAVARDEPSANDPLCPETELGWFETLLLADGLIVFRADQRRKPKPSDRLLQIGEFPIGFAEPTLVVEVIDDSSEFQHAIQGGNLRSAINYFRHGDQHCAFPPVDTGLGHPLIGIAITDATLGKLMGDELAGQLLDGLGLNPAPVAKAATIPRHISAPLRALVGSELDGSLMSLFAQAKALEYLCALAVHQTITARSQPRFVRKRDIVRRLHDDLAHRQGKVPTLGQLANQCGISPKTLNELFMQSYGLSIYSYMSTCQLRDAHTAILESSVPMKVLAERLGYSHVNNFIHAFSKRFGYSPGSLRRRRRTDDAA